MLVFLKILRKVLFLILLLVTSQTLSAANPSLPLNINRIIKSSDPDLNIGIVVQDATSEEIIYEKNAHRYFVPASNQKLFTALAALDYLSPKFTYQTRLFADSSRTQNGILSSDVYFQFSGDPTFNLNQLDRLIKALTQIGVKQINGNIIIDDSLLDTVEMSPGSVWDDKDFCYGAPLSTIIINHNCITAKLKPANVVNNPATLSLPGEAQFINIVNNVVTRSNSTQCSLILNNNDDKNYVINGCLKINDAEKELLMAIKNPRTYIQAAILFSLRLNQINGTPQFLFEKILNPPKLIATTASPPLKLLVTTMLKDSDNLIANALFKTIGALYTHEQGSWQNGSDAVQEILNNNLQLPLPHKTIIDGAGISRYNLVTPKQIVTLLQHAYTSAYAPTFISGLPVSGIDGTLKDRMKNKMTLNKVRAKTGTEKSATSLSGFLITNKKHLLIFSIMINGFVGSPLKYTQLEDQICAALIAEG